MDMHFSSAFYIGYSSTYDKFMVDFFWHFENFLSNLTSSFEFDNSFEKSSLFVDSDGSIYLLVTESSISYDYDYLSHLGFLAISIFSHTFLG